MILKLCNEIFIKILRFHLLIFISVFCTNSSIAAYYILEDPHLRKSFEQAILDITGKKLSPDSDIRMRNLGLGMYDSKKILLEIDGKKYLMKIFSKERPNITKIEIKAHKYASSIGIVPSLIYVDKDRQFIIMDYPEGTP